MNAARICKTERKTNETDICVELNLDASGAYSIDTGCGFLDHMLELFARHGSFALNIVCKGDANVDFHHSAEDTAILLGKAFKEALGNCAGINRYGSMILPMDEALIFAAVDVSGRGYLSFDLKIPAQKIGDFDTELVKEFMLALVRESGMTIHLRQIAGENSHHIIEGAFKALARALKAAVAIDPGAGGAIPSTKGTIR